MRKSAELAILAIFTLLVSPYRALGQEQKEPDHGYVDFGVRVVTGDVYGRPDLPFQPSLSSSQFNEYQDVRDGFYLRRLDVKFDNALHTKDYFRLQSQSTLYHDQGYLATFGTTESSRSNSATMRSRIFIPTPRERCSRNSLPVFGAIRH